mgnify:CR=1 FL=1
MDKKINKVLPVRFSGKSSRSPNFRIVGDVSVYPDSVHVTGGLHWLKKCNAIYTDSIDLLSNAGEIERKVNLKLLSGAKAAEGKTVQVKMMVQSLKSRQMEVMRSFPAIMHLYTLLACVAVPGEESEENASSPALFCSRPSL